MKKSLALAFSVLTLGSMLFAGGCVVGVDAGPGPDACLTDNSACDFDSDCCSGICAADGYCGVPAEVSTCTPNDVSCVHDAECCSNLCAADGFCGVP
jgi:hypothetical protein